MRKHSQAASAPKKTCTLCGQRLFPGDEFALLFANRFVEDRVCAACHALFAEYLVVLRDAPPVETAEAGAASFHPR